jgi:phosphohistidine phosphatase
VKTLLMMRHGKSDWQAGYARDHDRPLNDRGIESAKVMGRVLTDRGLAPDHVISSSAVRAEITARLAAEAGGWQGAIAIDPVLYGASPHEVIHVAAHAPDVGRLMLVGHQPTWAATVYELTGKDIEMKTASVAVIESQIESWHELFDGMGQLVETLYPRDFM